MSTKSIDMTKDAISIELKSGVEATLVDFKELPKTEAHSILAVIAAIEKKSFPTNEALTFNAKFLSKPNTRTLYVADPRVQFSVIAYCVCTRFRSALILHKLCVADCFRNQGVGKFLLAQVLKHAERTACSNLELWVDPARVTAINLYTNAGLSQQYAVRNYYAPGRDGIKMSIQLPI